MTASSIINEGSWSYYNPVEVLFGPGSLNKLQQYIAGERVLLLTTPGFTRRGTVNQICQLLKGKDITVHDKVNPNPDLSDIEESLAEIKETNPEVIVALGGGSVLDSAKAYSLVLGTPPDFSLRKHLEEKTSLPGISPVPWVAIPTTAGTGSEVTPFATLWYMDILKKYSLSSRKLFSSVAVLDPELTVNLPEETTISSGLDALSHALESLWNKNANTVTALYSQQAVKLVLDSLYPLTCEPGNLQLRSCMMQASLLGGMAISVTRTALAHSISYPVTASFGMPHGLACSFTLPQLLEFNHEVDDGRIEELVQSIGYNSMEELKDKLQSMFDKCGVNSLLKKYVSSVEEIKALSSQMITPGRADNNLRDANVRDVEDLLEHVKTSYYF